MALAVKKVCRLAYREGLITRQLFAHVTIERGENKQSRALDRASLDKLQSLAFEPYEVELETARDLFLFACYTGVAYCDMVSLERKHLLTDDEGALWLKFRRQKTDTLCRVKLLPEAVHLIERYQSKERATLFAPIAYSEQDVLLSALTIEFFEDYRFYLKREGYAPATINSHPCWLSRLMYRAVSRGTIRFNPFEEVKYEAVERKPHFLSKGDASKLLAFPLQGEGAELSRRMFLFSVFTGLAFVDLQGLRASQIETNSEGKRYIRKARQKTKVESLIPMHPIAEQILTLYTKEKSRGDYKIFPDTMSDWKLLRHLKAVGLACGIRTPLTWHCARHTFGTLTLEAGMPIESIAKMMGHSSIASTQIYAQVTDQKIARDMERVMQKTLECANK